MNVEKKFPKLLRVITGLIAFLMILVAVGEPLFVENYEFTFRKGFQIFGIFFLGFIAVKGTDPITYLQRKYTK